MKSLNKTEATSYRDLIDQAPEAVVVLDVDTGLFVDFNEKALAFFACSAAELRSHGPINLSPKEIDGKDASSYARALIEEAILGGNPVFDWVHTTLTGAVIPCEIRLVRFPPYDKNLVRASIIDKRDEKDMERALKDSEERLKIALRATEMGYYDWYLLEDRLLWDDQLYRILGFDSSSDVDRMAYFFQIIHPADVARVEASVAKAMAPGTEDVHFKDEYRIVVGQEVKYIRSNGIIFKNQDRQVYRVIGTCQDITALRSKEMLLQKTTEKLEEAQRLAKIGSFETDLTTRTTWWSDGMYAIFHLKPGTITPSRKLFAKYVFEEDQKIIDRKITACIDDAIPQILEYRLQLDNGTIKHMNDRIWPVTNDTGKVIGLKGTSQDVTDQKIAEESLRYQATLLKSISDAVIATDQQFIIRSWNKAAEDLYGWKEEEVLGKPMIEIVPLIEYVDSTREQVLREFLAKGKWKGEVVQQQRGGKHLHILSAVTSVKTPDGNTYGALAVNRDISDRKAAEQALARSEAQYRALAENFPNGLIALFDHDLRYTVVNGQGLAQIGMKPAHLEGKRLRDVFPTEIFKRDEPNLLAALAGETRETVVSFGPEFFRVITLPVKDSTGKIINGMVVSQNVTALRLAEQKLRESEEKFSKAFNNHAAAMMIFNIDTGERIEVNDRFVELYGFSKEELKDHNLFENNIAQTHKKAIRGIQQLKRDGYVRNFPLDIATKSGAVKNILIDAAVLEFGDNNLAIVSHYDITERKKAQEKLANISERLQLSTRAAQVGIWDWDIPADQLYWDKTMHELYQMDPDTNEKKYETWTSSIHPLDRQKVTADIQEALEGKKEYNTEFRIQLSDGKTHFIKAMGTVQRDEQGNPIRMIGTNWDITKEKDAERQRLRTRQLELKNMELEQFAYIASHDLQEPLRTVVSFAGLLKRRYESQLDDQAHQYIDFIGKGAARMSQLVKALLEYSRIGANKMIES
jgi:PAS domain S-box-containing protein